MSRLIVVLLAFAAGTANAAIWPDKFGPFVRANIGAVNVQDRPLWDEYGLAASERAEYVAPSGRFLGFAYRMKDPTGAVAAFQWRRPADAKESLLTDHAASNGKVLVVAFANYLIEIQGTHPDTEEFDALAASLPNVDRGAPPWLTGYLPPDNLVANSERYVLGPVALERFLPSVSPSAAAFRFGAEAQVAKYGSGGSESTLGIFSYPTPNIARERVADFQGTQGLFVKREGPLVVAVAGATPDDAERLLAKVVYKPAITLNENPNKPPENIGTMIVAILALAGILIVASLIAGFLFGGLRVALARFGIKPAQEPITSLHIGEE